jgi:hypothetical protein
MAASLSNASGLLAWMSLAVAAIGIPGYRRSHYALLWLAAMTSFGLFYYSDYLNPLEHEYSQCCSPSLTRALHDGFIWPVVFLFPFLGARFYTDASTGLLVAVFTFACLLSLGANLWHIVRSRNGTAAAATWVALVLFAIGIASLVVIGRGANYPVVPRYSPGGDGFWIAFIGLALLVSSLQPPAILACSNIGLLVILVILTAHKDWRFLVSHASDGLSACEQSVLNYPLYRDSDFRKCFEFSEDQSVYHLAALRLSVFRKEHRQLIVPRADDIVITDMPNRWLSVYVRDYMLAGVVSDKILSIAPTIGEWVPPVWHSPFYQGEWSTDILPEPLVRTWATPSALFASLAGRFSTRPLVWYLNTPETEFHMPEIEQFFAKFGYTKSETRIENPRYRSARFSLWCFQ